jgi:O-antigen/teichoic acid export membrane protein
MHEVFIFFYILSKFISTIFLLYKARKIIAAKSVTIKDAIKEVITDISIGIKLLLANIASLLIVGIGRLIIDDIWGVEMFGKLSFSLSLTNFFLLFVGQVSMVLFPALRRIDLKTQNRVYELIREMLSIFLPFVLVGYIPVKIFISLWLPAYVESVKYLALLLPICVFDAKMQILCNTYYKVLRKEKILLSVNVLAMMISVILCTIGGYYIKNVVAITVSMVIAIAFRSLISEIYLANLLGRKIIKKVISEVILVLFFMYTAWILDEWVSFVLYIIAYLIYILINIKGVELLLGYIKQSREH